MLLIVSLLNEQCSISYAIELRRQLPSPGTSCTIKPLSLATLLSITEALPIGSLDNDTAGGGRGGVDGQG